METLFIFAAVIAAYFLPSAIAAQRKHKNFMPIAITNLIFGWTGIGWLVTFIWAFTSNISETKAAKAEQ